MAGKDAFSQRTPVVGLGVEMKKPIFGLFSLTVAVTATVRDFPGYQELSGGKITEIRLTQRRFFVKPHPQRNRGRAAFSCSGSAKVGAVGTTVLPRR
jgi:hypothetical protein